MHPSRRVQTLLLGILPFVAVLVASPASAQPTPISLDDEHPLDRHTSVEEDRAALHDASAQAVGAGLLTVAGVLSSLTALVGFMWTALAAGLGSDDSALTLGLVSGTGLSLGISMAAGGGAWWIDTGDRAARLANRLRRRSTGQIPQDPTWGPTLRVAF